VGQLTADGVFLVVRDARGRVLEQTTNFSAGEEPRDPVWERALASGNPVGIKAELTRRDTIAPACRPSEEVAE